MSGVGISFRSLQDPEVRAPTGRAFTFEAKPLAEDFFNRRLTG
jgi:hypothetical protein